MKLTFCEKHENELIIIMHVEMHLHSGECIIMENELIVIRWFVNLKRKNKQINYGSRITR